MTNLQLQSGVRYLVGWNVEASESAKDNFTFFVLFSIFF